MLTILSAIPQNPNVWIYSHLEGIIKKIVPYPAEYLATCKEITIPMITAFILVDNVVAMCFENHAKQENKSDGQSSVNQIIIKKVVVKEEKNNK